MQVPGRFVARSVLAIISGAILILRRGRIFAVVAGKHSRRLLRRTRPGLALRQLAQHRLAPFLLSPLGAGGAAG